MKTFATATRRRGPAGRSPMRRGRVTPTVARRAGRRAEIHRILHGHRLQSKSGAGATEDRTPEVKQGVRETDLPAETLLQSRLQRLSSPSSSSSSGSSSGSDSSDSSGGGEGGEIPTPTPKEDGTCDCRMDLCWRPIDLWYVPSHFKHGFINVIDSGCNTHNLYVDPGQHGGHSHAVDKNPGWDTSGERCLTHLGTLCSMVDQLPAATTRYEGLDVAYDATSGPNSNSFLEWILDEVGYTGIPSPHSGLMAWDYYTSNPAHRASPPRHPRGGGGP